MTLISHDGGDHLAPRIRGEGSCAEALGVLVGFAIMMVLGAALGYPVRAGQPMEEDA